MPTKRKKQSSHPATAGAPALEEILAKAALPSLNTIVRNPDGTIAAKYPDDVWHMMLDEIASGNTIRNVTSQLGMNRAALHERASRDPDFAAKLRIALEVGSFSMIENALDVAAGGDLSTGSIERDKLVVDLAKWYAARVGRSQFGDRPMFNAESVTITLRQDADDVC